jgi:lipopolysaccharide/colanic/teichoic acid biosynthesis glycosyltransferase
MKEKDNKNLLNEVKLEVITCLKEERTISDTKYAIKIVESIVFTLVGLICLGVIGALINLVVLK